jgi:DNA-binding response OmpR family regulator
MKLTIEQIRRALSGCRILIVEDDRWLADRIAMLFAEYADTEPKVAESVEAARTVVPDVLESFDLAVIDVMLPKTSDDLKIIREHQETLDSLRREIAEIGAVPADKQAEIKLADARYRRSQALAEINNLIDTEGGIALVEAWRNVSKGHVLVLPVLYLAAVSKEATVRRGLEAAKYSDWLIKPVPSELILEKGVSLLLGKRSPDKR